MPAGCWHSITEFTDMRWKARPKKTPIYLSNGPGRRYEVRFALWPRRVLNGACSSPVRVWVWLEHYLSAQSYGHYAIWKFSWEMWAEDYLITTDECHDFKQRLLAHK